MNQQIAANPPTVQTSNGTMIANTSGSTTAVGTKVPNTPAAPKYNVASPPQLITPASGKSYLLVRVNGPKGNVKIQVSYIGAKQVVKKFTRLIPTNKLSRSRTCPRSPPRCVPTASRSSASTPRGTPSEEGGPPPGGPPSLRGLLGRATGVGTAARLTRRRRHGTFERWVG